MMDAKEFGELMEDVEPGTVVATITRTERSLVVDSDIIGDDDLAVLLLGLGLFQIAGQNPESTKTLIETLTERMPS